MADDKKNDKSKLIDTWDTIERTIDRSEGNSCACVACSVWKFAVSNSLIISSKKFFCRTYAAGVIPAPDACICDSQCTVWSNPKNKEVLLGKKEFCNEQTWIN